MSSTIRSQLITDSIMARVDTISGIRFYRVEVEDQPPRYPDSDRVAPYGVVYPFPGKPGPGGDLGNVSDDLDYTVQVTLAAGFAEDCEAAVDKTHKSLYLFSPTIAGVVLGQLQPPAGYDPGPIRIDRTITPPRSSLPLQYRLVATAN